MIVRVMSVLSSSVTFRPINPQVPPMLAGSSPPRLRLGVTERQRNKLEVSGGGSGSARD
jgi:hypothetical protein